MKVGHTCRESLLKGNLPQLSTTNGFVYPPKPDSLPCLNEVEEEVQTIESLARSVPHNVTIEVHPKRRILARPVYKAKVITKSKVYAWLNNEPINEDDVERREELKDLNDPLQLACALNSASKTMAFHDVIEMRLLNERHYLVMDAGEGRTPIFLLYDSNSEELSFLQIYPGQLRKITSFYPTSFAMASSKTRRTDHRGVEPMHMLYIAMKVTRHNLVERTTIFRANDTTCSITTKQLKMGVPGGCRELRLGVDVGDPKHRSVLAGPTA
ncbi:hypothetical protein HPB48_011546 [Haemaphysalis longicornis]|uniref:Uncharacterized protein n=1 Tax=Haemaphysalis longicornis TaxID=44386 RepID=A0A9J6FYA6_HAELO|nr:hypothetical protein HPB48_011546 [Haemaphysalis longicornis]